MNWQYQTMLFEFQKEGLLGDKYIDDEEVESLLNEQGDKEWELVSVTPVQEGLLAFLKREVKTVEKQEEVQEEPVKPEHVYEPQEEVMDNYMASESDDHVQVLDQEFVHRQAEKRQKHMAKGDSDLVGGIRIS